MLAKCKLDGSETIWPCEYETCPFFGQCDSEWKAELYRQPTNADRIRAMSDEELAEFLDKCENKGYEDSSVALDGCGHTMPMLDWLRQPAEVREDGN